MLGNIHLLYLFLINSWLGRPTFNISTLAQSKAYGVIAGSGIAANLNQQTPQLIANK